MMGLPDTLTRNSGSSFGDFGGYYELSLAISLVVLLDFNLVL